MAALFAVALVATNWVIVLEQFGYAWHVGAAVLVLLLERVVRGSAPSPFGWVRWRTSLRMLGW